MVIKMIKKILGSIVVLAALIIVGLWLLQHDTSDNSRNIEFIKAHLYNGKIIDMQNELHIKNPLEDIKWYMSDHDTLSIEYGKILLKYKISDFVKPEIQQMLNSIGITTKQNKDTLKFTLYYLEDELKEYVKK